MNRRFLFAAITTAVVGGVCEGAARVGGSRLLPAHRSFDAMPGEPVPGEADMVVDTVTGWRPRVGKQQSFGIPGGTVVTTRGVRGKDVAIPKPKGERRILMLGDSTVFGVLVSDAEVFSARLEHKLQSIDPQIHVLNGGAPGWSSYQAQRALETRLIAYAPDLVVIGTLWSDTQGAEQADSVRFSPLFPILEHSSAFVIGREWVRELRWGHGAEEVRVGLRPPGSGPGPTNGPNAGNNGGNKRPIIGVGGAPTVRVSLAEYRENLKAIAAFSAAHGAASAFLVLPCVRDPDGHGVGDFRDDYRAAMRETAAALGAPIADTPAAFAGRPSSAMFSDEVHPTAAGHSLIADVLATTLNPWAQR